MNRAERRRKGRSKLTKYFENSPIQGRGDKELVYSREDDSRPLTPWLAFDMALQAGLPRDKNTDRNQRTVNKIFDSLDDQVTEGEKGEDIYPDYAELGDTDWDFLKPLVESAALRLYQYHEPFIMDALNERANLGKPTALIEADEIWRSACSLRRKAEEEQVSNPTGGDPEGD